MSMGIQHAVSELIMAAMSELRVIGNVEIKVDTDKNFEEINSLYLHFL